MASVRKPTHQSKPVVVPAMVSNVAGIREKLRANIGRGAPRKRDIDTIRSRRGPLRPVIATNEESPLGCKATSHVPLVPVLVRPQRRVVKDIASPVSSLKPSLPPPSPPSLPLATTITSASPLGPSSKNCLTSTPALGDKPSSLDLQPGRRILRRPASLLSLLPSQACSLPHSRPSSPSAGCCRRTPSPGSALDPALLEVVKLRVRKVRAIRLYLLQRVGPHSFLVAADPPEHKYKVTIGPQSCTCGQGSHCIHLLFVMLRVLQVRETDPKVFSKKLKNFEVEELTQKYAWRRSRQKAGHSIGHSIKSISSSQSRLPPSRGISSNYCRISTLSASRSESSLQEALKNKDRKQLCAEDEDNKALCPICLLDMVEEENLVTCEKGCRNKFHYHCIAIWAEECRRQNENILCPLCRALWADNPRRPVTQNTRNSVKASPASRKHLPVKAVSPSSEVPPPVKAPLNPCQSTSQVLTSLKSSSLKRSLKTRDSLRNQDTQAWSQVFGSEFLSWILSPHWPSREKGLIWLSHQISSVLSGKQDTLDSGSGVSTKLGPVAISAGCPMVVEVCCRVVAFMVTDPVYKVFIAALRVWRTLVSHSLCKSETDFIRLIELTKPIIRAVLLKCADGNRRVSQLSIATLVEMARGESGAFAVGSETEEQVLNLENSSLSVEYLLKCALEESPESDPEVQKRDGNWQWLLGRLAVAERLMEEFPQEFYLLYVPSLPSSVGGSLGTKAQSFYKILNYDRLISLLEFTKNALEHPHSTVNKMAHRIIILASRFSIHIPPVFSEVLNIVGTLDSTVQRSMLRKLRVILDELKSPVPLSVRDRNAFPKMTKKAEAERQQEKNLIQEKLVTTETSTQKILSKLLLSRFKLPGFANSSEKKRPTYLPLQKTNSALLETSKCAKSSQTSFSDNELCVDVLSNTSRGDCNLGVYTVSDHKIDLSPSLTLTSPCSPMSIGTELSTPLSPVSWNTSGTKSIGSSLNPNHEASWESFSNVLSPVIPGLADRTDNEMAISLQSQADNHKQTKLGMYEEDIDWIRGPLIGTGAFSSCYQARDTRTGTLMAVKQVSFFRNEESEQEKVIKAIEDEIVMMLKLRHPNVLRILGANRQGGHYNVFVEWMAGGSVASLLDRYGAFTEDVLLGYTYQVLDGLSYLHSNHILHRDLKGANLLVDSRGHHLRIADFGAAARLASQATVDGEFQGQLLGTIAFMAPEVLRGEDYGRSCDIWSVGCVIIEMATTKPPWNANDVSNHLALIFKIACSKSPPAIPENLSPEAQDVVMQCLQVQSQDRPTSRQLMQHPVFQRVPSVVDSNYSSSRSPQQPQQEKHRPSLQMTPSKCNQVPARLTAVAC